MGAETPVENTLVSGTKERGGWPAKMVDTGRRGAPDRECRFPGPLTIFIETKAPNGKLEPWQVEYHNDLKAMGYIVLVLWSVPLVEKFFADFDRGVYG